MLTLDRYLLKLFFGHFAIVLIVLTGLYGMIEFLEKVDSFIEHGAGFANYLSYPLYKLPLMLSQMLPMAVLLATFATIGLLSRTHQLTAFKSCGIGVGRVSRPLFLAGALLCLAMLAGNWAVPWSARESSRIFDTEVRGNPRPENLTSNLYFRNDQQIISIARSVPAQQQIQGLTVLDFDQRFRVVKRLEAPVATHQGHGRWLLSSVVERTFSTTGEIRSFERYAELLVDFGRRPEELVELWYQPEEMTSPELLRLTARLEGEGHDSRRYRAEWHLRLAQTFTPLMMVLLGVPFALQRGRQGSLGSGVAMALAIFALYYLLQAIGMALGTAGLLPLPLGAWSANLLLLLSGGWLFLTLDS
jgi:lipopolysaccharide export system permease protein